jgi:hypothetical protein
VRSGLGRYDSTLQMYCVVGGVEPDARHLEFQRWLVDEGLHVLDTGAWPIQWRRDTDTWEWVMTGDDDDGLERASQKHRA